MATVFSWNCSNPKETPKYKLSEEEQKLYNYAIDIINNYNPSSYGYVQPIEETLREVDTVIIELSANPNDKDYLKYLQNETDLTNLGCRRINVNGILGWY